LSDKENDKRKAASSQDEEERSGGQRARGRTTAEWITLGISVLIIASLVGLLSFIYFTSGTRSPVIKLEAKLEEVRREGEEYYLPITVTNEGERTAQDVEVELSLDTGEGDPETVGFTVQFLAGGESDYETAVFSSDPSQGELSHVISFSTP
jgi:uncharacterized protein (TIGR02588 family)